MMVVGSGGAGKSVLAREIGARTGLPVIHLDALFWQPGWVETPRERWREIQREALAGPDWVVDGNYGGTLDERLALADVVVLLDYSRLTCLLGVVVRWLRHRGKSRPDMAPGCPERLKLDFLGYVWAYPARRRPSVLAKVHAFGKDDALVRLHNRREAREWVATLGP